MSEEEEQVCERCYRPAGYAVTRQAGERQITHVACVTHLAWTVDYMTVPGRQVTVTNMVAAR